MAEHNPDVALSCRGITKSFGSSPVLKSISLDLELGTVTALSGENGAGKSTLMKIISGQVRPDSGEITVRGHQLPFGNPRAAHKLGVAIVPQELASIQDMAVYENIFVGREIRKKSGLLDRRAMIAEAHTLLQSFDVDIAPQTLMRKLPVGLKQIVEIVKNSSTGARVLLLDEPTSAISDREVAGLYKVVRHLRDQGVAMVYTTHKMEEIQAIADRVVVLRDGNLVMDQPLASISDDDIVTAMIGRELETLFPPTPTRPADPGEPLLQLDDVLVDGAGGPVSLAVGRGEIVGLAGLVGAGRTELLEAVFGTRKIHSGHLHVNGKQMKKHHPVAAIQAGIALIPEDRKHSGAVLSMSILDNGSLPRLSNYTVAGWLNRGKQNAEVSAAMKSVNLKSRGLSQPVETLSGGNQQKVVLARWLTDKVDVLLLDEPTRGVDVGARSEIYRIIVDLAASGMAVLMASSDMQEILGLSHRAIVMREGQIVGTLDRDSLTKETAQEEIFKYASGLGSTPAPLSHTEGVA
ncbi:sugar ABC transporter [Arthrobacter sp. Leaf337]|uniref:sugar ABC transporter ATP-binding protein n=1 Tax=Arthrobacter sp. Leaf337 TaxID=1736342 RepID=UPI0006FCF474|nr:sugar ABC transporter ATP-binding protein [Arthrobacter sp. Leaf337]KQR82467.1 sugar ABC transporter [Arthrobacter sp. Leaf337]